VESIETVDSLLSLPPWYDDTGDIGSLPPSLKLPLKDEFISPALFFMFDTNYADFRRTGYVFVVQLVN